MPKYLVIRHGIQWHLRYILLDDYSQSWTLNSTLIINIKNYSATTNQYRQCGKYIKLQTFTFVHKSFYK